MGLSKAQRYRSFAKRSGFQSAALFSEVANGEETSH